MLIFSRRRLQAVVFDLPDGSRVRISVRLIEGSTVSLGIEVPASVQVWREEQGPPISPGRRRVRDLVFPCPSCGTLLVELPHGTRFRPEGPRRFSCRRCGLLVVREASGRFRDLPG